MSYQTDEKIKSFLDTNQLHREQMCRAILEIDKRFSEVRSRHPRGGPDGGRDIQALYRENEISFGAIGFVNQANDSKEQKKINKKKFLADLKNAISANKDLTVFVFFTNINLTIGEKDIFIMQAKKEGILTCDIFDRERIRIILDSPDGFSIRFQYLNISLSEAEQASFFSRWGDDIQSVISSGFQKIESTFNRVLFLQEATEPIDNLTISFELDKIYDAEEIGHFRSFVQLTLKEPKHNIFSLLFGSTDKSSRMWGNKENNFTEQKMGIKHGISSGQWEDYIDLQTITALEDEDEDEKWIKVGSGSSIGRDNIEFISISYSKDSFIRLSPVINLRDIDNAMFLPFINKSLAKKIKTIHIYSNGYKLQEIRTSEFEIDTTEIEPNFPIIFEKEELKDSWVRIRPKGLSTFYMQFFENTPKRLFLSNQIEDSLEKRRS